MGEQGHGAAKLPPKRKPVKFQYDHFPEFVDPPTSIVLLLHVHNLVFMILLFLPLREAVRASCVSQNWLHAWRFYPDLEFTSWSFGLNKRVHKAKRKAKFVRCIDTVIRNHAATGVKSFTIKRNLNNQKYAHYLDRLIYFGVSSGAKKLTVDLVPRLHPHHRDIHYKFPSSNFEAPEYTSIKHLKLCFCYLRPAPTFIGLNNLKTLDLSYVRINREDLESLLSYTLALQLLLKLKCCPGLDYLTISDAPCKLKYRDIGLCLLKGVEICVPNLVTFNYCGVAEFKFVLSEASVLKEAQFELYGGDAAEWSFQLGIQAIDSVTSALAVGNDDAI